MPQRFKEVVRLFQFQMSGLRALIEGVFGGRFPRDFGELGGIWGVDRAAEM